jgi:rhomboid protease GluP
MSQHATEPREQLLRLVAAAAPEPWYPGPYVEKHKVDPAALFALLEELYLDGLIEKGPRSRQMGPGVMLSERGRQVLADPELLDRLRQGKPLAENDRGAAVRAALRSAGRPVVTLLLVLANVAVFAWGLHVAAAMNMTTRDYLSGPPLFGKARGNLPPALVTVMHRLGSVSREDVAEGHWWRLLTASWVHFGLPHLLMNLLGLYLVGRLIEAWWGRWRCLVIYLVSAWASVCFGVMHAGDTPVVGASGGVCGLMAAEVVWLLANRRCLPGSQRRQALGGMIFTVALLVVFIWMPGGSGWGHGGGAVAGAVAAILLQVQRFGPAVFRGPALAGVALLPFVVLILLQRHFADQVFTVRVLAPANQLTGQTSEFFKKKVELVVEQRPARRKAAAVDALLPDLDRYAGEASQLAAVLRAAGPRRDPVVEEARQRAGDYMQALGKLCEEMARCLKAGEGWDHKDEKALQAQEEQVEQLWKPWRDQWRKVSKKER